MSWPIPLPDAIADRASGVFEREFARVWALANPGAPPATVDARSPTSSLAIMAKVLGMSLFDVWMFLQRLVRELMPDTAVDWLDRHGIVWGIAGVAAAPFSGTATFAGTSATIPSGAALTAPSGAVYVTTAGATIVGTGTVSVAIQASVAGAAGTLPTGTLLTLVSALEGLSPQSATVDSGATPGEDIEDIETWRGRIIARIRQRGAGGNAADFEQWTQEVYPGALVKASSPGVGLVTVAFAMPTGSTWRAPTSGEVAAVSAYLNDASVRKPLGAPFIAVTGATIVAVPVTLHLSPDTAGTEAAAQAALATFFLTEGIMGSTLPLSRINDAISNGSGEYSHTLALPAADVGSDNVTVPVLGTVTFT